MDEYKKDNKIINEKLIYDIAFNIYLDIKVIHRQNIIYRFKDREYI